MEKKIEMFQALMKSPQGGYIAVLSDDSLDRDGEIVGESALHKVIKTQNGKVPILLNHENKIENLVGEWSNRRMEKSNGHNALIAEPKFYLSNPKAQMIKGLLDDGAECGISIGAIVKDKEVQKINGRDTTVFTDLELLEASFVAIPSNRHGAAMAVAKSFMSNKEEEPMDKQTKKSFEEQIETLNKEIENKDSIISKLTEELKQKEEVKEEKEEVKEEVKEEESKESSLKLELDNLKKEIENLKEQPVNKGDLSTVESVDKQKLEVEEAKKKGYLPIITRGA